jgi:hypothetical protein
MKKRAPTPQRAEVISLAEHRQLNGVEGSGLYRMNCVIGRKNLRSQFRIGDYVRLKDPDTLPTSIRKSVMIWPNMGKDETRQITLIGPLFNSFFLVSFDGHEGSFDERLFELASAEVITPDQFKKGGE